MYCQNCGKENTAESRFCTYCGANLASQKIQQARPNKAQPKTTGQKPANTSSRKSKNPLAVIILVAVAVFIIWTVAEKDKADISSDAPNSSDWEDDYNNQDYESMDSMLVYDSYEVSASGFLVNAQVDPYTYPASDIDILSGIFRMDADEENLVVLGDFERLGQQILSSGTVSGEVRVGTNLPICIDRSKGDQLIVVGSEWSGRSENERRNMVIEIYPADLLGYGNSFMLSDLDVAEIDSINGVSISSVNTDFSAVTDMIGITGVSCIRCTWGSNTYAYRDMDYLIASQYESVMECGYYEGTQFMNRSVSMTHPYVRIDSDRYITLSVQATKNGYFIIDISQLPSGLYMIDGLMKDNLLVVE